MQRGGDDCGSRRWGARGELKIRNFSAAKSQKNVACWILRSGGFKLHIACDQDYTHHAIRCVQLPLAAGGTFISLYKVPHTTLLIPISSSRMRLTVGRLVPNLRDAASFRGFLSCAKKAHCHRQELQQEREQVKSMGGRDNCALAGNHTAGTLPDPTLLSR